MPAATVDASDQYEELDQPIWAPPSWSFGPVWTALYLAMAIAGWRVWRLAGWPSAEVGLWAGQLFLHGMRSPLFFALQWRGFAFGWVILLDVAVAATIWMSWRRDRVAAGLLLPYLVWILFATALNGAIWWLNR